MILHGDFLCALCVSPMKIGTQRSLRLVLFISLHLLVLSTLFSQEKSIAEQITAVAEEIASHESEPMLSEVFAEMLNELAEDHVLINSGDENEIRRLFFLSEFAVKSLADYVKNYGPVYSLAELASVPGFNRETAAMIAPFISLESSNDISPGRSVINQSLLTSVILKPGVSDPSAPGSQIRAITRYKFTSGNFSGGFTAEKDPGEKILQGSPPVTDFFSFHCAFSGKGFIKRVIIGDYSARFGLGTSVNTRLSTGFSLTSPGNLSGRNEIKSYTSSDENNFFRGIAAVLGGKNLELSMLFSTNQIDAAVNIKPDSSSLSVRNLYTSGYHNSQSTILNKDALRETCTGVNLSYNKGNLKTGLTLFDDQFSLPFKPDSTDPFNLYNFRGKRKTLYSFYYNTVFKRILFSGEVSSSDLKGYAFVQTLSLRPADRLNISFLYRHHTPGYISFHGKSPGTSGTNNSGTGLSGSFTFEAAKFLFVSAGGDTRNYPWLRYGSSFPSTARRYEVRIKYLPSERLNLETLYQYRISESDGMERTGICLKEESVVQTIRFHAKYLLSENITFASRIDYKRADPGTKGGVLLLQDLIMKPGKIPITLWFRYCIFDTDDYESGIYTWENDLLYSYSIPVLYGKGTRNYLLIKWEPADFADIRIKYGFTSVSKDKLKEKFQDEIKFQLYLRF